MRLLYAAGNRLGSLYQYDRFLKSIKNHKHIELKTAAYTRSLGNLTADYTLDSLLSFCIDLPNIYKNGNYAYYREEIRRFNPDIIISDLEPFTSNIAIDLKINNRLWQVSPLLLSWAFDNHKKRAFEIDGVNAYTISFGSPERRLFYSKMIKRSAKRFIVAHFCDTIYYDQIKPEYKWIRPDFELVDDIDNEIKVSDGTAIRTADLFYNQIKYTYDIDLTDPEAVIVSSIDQYYNKKEPMNIKINDSIKFLSEMLR